VSALADVLPGVFVFKGTSSPAEAVFAPAYPYIRDLSAPPGAPTANFYHYIYAVRAPDARVADSVGCSSQIAARVAPASCRLFLFGAAAKRAGWKPALRIYFARDKKAHQRDLENLGTLVRFARRRNNSRDAHRDTQLVRIQKISFPHASQFLNHAPQILRRNHADLQQHESAAIAFSGRRWI
jgi:hypothetical protein